MVAFGRLSDLLLFFCFLVTCLPALTEAQGAITQALFFGNISSNASFSDCVWRRGNNNDECPDPDINYYLYTSDSSVKRKQINVAEADWLRTSGWNPEHENVFIIHGYNSGDDSDPVQVLRNAYLKEGGYNVVVVDWSPLSKPPCYPAAVHNLQSVARCAADTFTFLRNSGLPVKRTTCVGHSLGAHICGIMSKYLLFRMYRIIGLDPARPLVRGQNRLGRGDAAVVQVIHTNAGVYGETGRVGAVDFCLNGGKEQPFCANKTNVNLCSHVRSICYLAESINQGTARLAEPCRGRCPSAQRAAGNRLGVEVPLGQHTPDSASGMYCLSSSRAPYCPSAPGAPGDHRCCV